MHSGSSVVLSAQPIFSVATGIASIILEGRSLSDEDFVEADIESYSVKIFFLKKNIKTKF